MRLTPAVPVAIAGLTACGSSDRPLALGALSQADREWAVIIAQGLSPYLQLDALYDDADEGVRHGATCPAVTARGDHATLKGGCHRDGVRIDGRATIGHFPRLRAPDLPAREDARWSAYRIEYDGYPERALTTDGTAESETLAGGYRIRADATFARGASEVHLDGEIACSAAGDCAAAGGTVLSVDGGRADVVGAWNLDGFSGDRGRLELRGADVLRIDIADQDQGGCYAATLDGAEVERICVWGLAGG
jgi:hypothetical protein